VVHNRFVVESLRERGAVFVDELNEIPDGETVIFSAHGVSKAVRDEAAQRDLRVFDATCPLVTKVHLEVARYSREGYEVILIGHRGHPEVEGTMGQYHDRRNNGGIHLVVTVEDVEQLKINNPTKIAYVTQTTLSMDDTGEVITALRQRFPLIESPKKDDICYATQNRQDAVKDLARSCDLVLVVGSPNSSNSNRLREVAERLGTKAFLIDDGNQIREEWLEKAQRIGVTAGASAPEVLVNGVLERLRKWGGKLATEKDTKPEEVSFPLPRELT
jgi:4-hydroxy-3-methylbut-2-enyl diphosphate reductase